MAPIKRKRNTESHSTSFQCKRRVTECAMRACLTDIANQYATPGKLLEREPFRYLYRSGLIWEASVDFSHEWAVVSVPLFTSWNMENFRQVSSIQKANGWYHCQYTRCTLRTRHSLLASRRWTAGCLRSPREERPYGSPGSTFSD